MQFNLCGIFISVKCLELGPYKSRVDRRAIKSLELGSVEVSTTLSNLCFILSSKLSKWNKPT